MVYKTTVAAPVFSLRREIDRLFEDTFGQPGATSAVSGWAPAVDIAEHDAALTIAVDLPGVRPEQVEITHENGVLTIRGEKHEMGIAGDEGARYHLVERAAGAFSRSFQLPKGLDESKIDAAYDHGVLTVRIPKAARPQPTRIEIKTGNVDAPKRQASAQPTSATTQGTSNGTRQAEHQAAPAGTTREFATR
jgi:HSP20 family protein